MKTKKMKKKCKNAKERKNVKALKKACENS